MHPQDHSSQNREAVRSLSGQFSPEGNDYPQRHSGFGIASFVLGLVSGLALFILTIAAGIVVVSNPEVDPEESPELIMLGIGMMGFMGCAVIGAGLGIAGLCQRNRKKIFAILGTVFSVITVLTVLFFMLLGMSE